MNDVFHDEASDRNSWLGESRGADREFVRKNIGHCDLCSKALHEDEEISEVSLHGRAYRFCCRTCASVFMNRRWDEERAGGRSPEDVKAALRDSGLLTWLEEAVRANASDLFLSAGEQPTLKVYGSFKRIDEVILNAGRIKEIVRAILPEEKRARFLTGEDVDVGLGVEGLARFRVNVFTQRNGHSLAVRPLPYRIPSMDELRLPEVFQDFLLLKRGLILITGPAGSGKTTTLAAFVDTINQREERHVITIEDPIEYVIPNKRSLVHQREVGRHTPSFADGLRNALRESPDIIVVGELRDLESISLAVRAAETGHLVLGTLHSGTAVQTLTRILDVFDSARQSQIRVQLAQSLQAICSQRLIKRCAGRGMVLATEVMIATLALRNIIRQNRVQEIRGFMETGMREKMHTLKQSIQALVEAGVVSEEALSDAGDQVIPGVRF